MVITLQANKERTLVRLLLSCVMVSPGLSPTRHLSSYPNPLLSLELRQLEEIPTMTGSWGKTALYSFQPCQSAKEGADDSEKINENTGY